MIKINNNNILKVYKNIPEFLLDVQRIIIQMIYVMIYLK